MGVAFSCAVRRISSVVMVRPSRAERYWHPGCNALLEQVASEVVMKSVKTNLKRTLLRPLGLAVLVLGACADSDSPSYADAPPDPADPARTVPPGTIVTTISPNGAGDDTTDLEDSNADLDATGGTGGVGGSLGVGGSGGFGGSLGIGLGGAGGAYDVGLGGAGGAFDSAPADDVGGAAGLGGTGGLGGAGGTLGAP
jgi:hypothetical protein